MKTFPALNLPPINLKIEGDKVFDVFRNKWIKLTPEEWVRQNFLHFLVKYEGFPKGLISVEKQIQLLKLKKRYDAVVFNNKLQPLVLIEFKAPNVNIDQAVVDQAVRYNQEFQVEFLILSNGLTHYIIEISYVTNTCAFLTGFGNLTEKIINS